MADVFTKEKRSWVMSRIRGKDTGPELTVRKALWNAGLRYRKHFHIYGRPDIAFPSKKIAVFVDGDFWHGHNWKKLRPKLKNKYWIDKITKNRKRANEVNSMLASQGWKVIRLWECDIKNNLPVCMKMIMNEVEKDGISS